MSQVKLTIFEVFVEGYHECSFVVSVGEKCIVRRKRGDQGPVLKVLDENDRDQLGHSTTCRLSSIGSIKFGNRTRVFGSRTHRKVPVRLCSIAEPIEKQSHDWSLIEFDWFFVRIGSIGYVGTFKPSHC